MKTIAIIFSNTYFEFKYLKKMFATINLIKKEIKIEFLKKKP